MRYKVVGEIQEPMPMSMLGDPDYISRTEYIILYMEDGSIIEYDLTNPKLILPSCRALMIIPTKDAANA